MKHAQYFNCLFWIVLIGAATATIGFAQSADSDAQIFRRDVRQLILKVKADKSGVYLLRSKSDAASGSLNFEVRKRSWVKLSGAEKLEIVRTWWQKWRAIRGAGETGILSLKNGGTEEIVCLMEKCHVPACDL